MTEFNRSGRRTALEGTGKISLGLFKTIACTVKDVSNSGARLGVDADQELPASFWIKIAGYREKRRAETRWRDGDQVGIEFVVQ